MSEGFFVAKVVGTVAGEGFHAGLYLHYKGGHYRALHLVHHHDTEERFVVYLSMEHPETIRLREFDSSGKESWADIIELEVADVLPPGVFRSGDPIARFRLVGP